jgi:hypothetical protein
MKTVIEQILNVVWFVGVWAVYFLLCHLVAQWGTRWGLNYKRLLIISIFLLPYTFLWVFMRRYRIKNSSR